MHQIADRSMLVDHRRGYIRDGDGEGLTFQGLPGVFIIGRASDRCSACREVISLIESIGSGIALGIRRSTRKPSQIGVAPVHGHSHKHTGRAVLRVGIKILIIWNGDGKVNLPVIIKRR